MMKIEKPCDGAQHMGFESATRIQQASAPKAGTYVPVLPPRVVDRTHPAQAMPAPPATLSPSEARRAARPYSTLLAEALGMQDEAVSDDALHAALGRCESLDLSAKNLQHDDMAALAPWLQYACVSLHTLILRNNPGCNAATLRLLAPMGELRRLDFAQTSLQEQGRLPLSGFKRLEYLDVSESFLDDPNSLAEAGAISTLQTLVARRNLFENAIFSDALSGLSGLRSLDLAGNMLDDVSICRLGSLLHLTYLNLSDNELPVSATALATLAKIESLVL